MFGAATARNRIVCFQLFEGTPLIALCVPWARCQLGLVSQEPVLFDRTIRENIAYGDNSRDLPMNEIMEAATEANAHGFISALPQVGSARSGFCA